MKTYELIIERRQPPCGGKPPKLYEFLTVQRPLCFPDAGEYGGFFPGTIADDSFKASPTE